MARYSSATTRSNRDHWETSSHRVWLGFPKARTRTRRGSALGQLPGRLSASGSHQLGASAPGPAIVYFEQVDSHDRATRPRTASPGGTGRSRRHPTPWPWRRFSSAPCELGRDPRNWKPAGPDGWNRGRLIAQGIADSYADEDWKFLLNTLSPSQVARQITCRSPGDRDRLLGLVDPERRADVKALLIVAA